MCKHHIYIFSKTHNSFTHIMPIKILDNKIEHKRKNSHIQPTNGICPTSYLLTTDNESRFARGTASKNVE